MKTNECTVAMSSSEQEEVRLGAQRKVRCNIREQRGAMERAWAMVGLGGPELIEELEG